MSAGRHAGVLEQLQTQRALALLARRDPRHDRGVGRQVVAGGGSGQKRDGRRVLHGWQQRILLAALRRWTATGSGQPRFFLRLGLGLGLLLDRRQGLPNVNDSLHCHLQDEQHTEHLVSDALFALPDPLREDVSEAPKTLGEMIVRAGKIERRQTEGVNGRQGSQRVEVLEDIFLQAKGGEELVFP